MKTPVKKLEGLAMNVMLVMQFDEIDYVVEADIEADMEYVDFKIARADGEDYERTDELMEAAMDAVGYVILNSDDVEIETLH